MLPVFAIRHSIPNIFGLGNAGGATSTTMAGFFDAIADEFNSRFNRKNAASGNEFVGFQRNGAVVIRDRRGTLKAEIPNVSEKAETLGSDPLAIYKPSGAKQVDAAKAMGNFTGWTYAAVNAIASEVANIQFRLGPVNGDDQEELSAMGERAHNRWPTWS